MPSCAAVALPRLALLCEKVACSLLRPTNQRALSLPVVTRTCQIALVKLLVEKPSCSRSSVGSFRTPVPLWALGQQVLCHTVM